MFHQGEESDLSIRMLEAGYLTRLGSADPIHHMESPRRDLRRMDYYGRRNDILFAWHNVPMPYFPIHLLGTTLNGFASAVRARRFQKMLEGMARGYVDCFRWRTKRRPVARRNLSTAPVAKEKRAATAVGHRTLTATVAELTRMRFQSSKVVSS